MDSQPSDNEYISDVSRRGMRAAIVGTCFKIISSYSFTNGLLLIFLTALGLDGATVISLLSLFSVVQALCMLPCAWLSDSFGKRFITLASIAFCGVGFVLLPMVNLFPARLMIPVLALAIVLYGIGVGGQVSCWYALLAPIVPSFYRGRFFGNLRGAWQMCGVLLATLISFLLPETTSLSLLKILLLGVAVSILPWGLYYARIPELERETSPADGLKTVMKGIVRSPGYMPFCAYLFIINLFIGGCPVLFGLVEKSVLGLGDSMVVTLANLTMIGSLFGFYIGGKAVDRIGTKPIFLVCHFGYGIALAAFVARNILPGTPFLVLAVSHTVFGTLMAAGSIAFSTEMLALIPPLRKSLSTSLCTTMAMTGNALSGLLGAWGIQMGLFSASWSLAGSPRSAYDAVLLVYAVMIVLMTVTLGLIPSVVGRPELRSGHPSAV